MFLYVGIILLLMAVFWGMPIAKAKKEIHDRISKAPVVTGDPCKHCGCRSYYKLSEHNYQCMCCRAWFTLKGRKSANEQA